MWTNSLSQGILLTISPEGAKGRRRMMEILTVEQVAQELQVNVKTVYQWIKSKRLKATNIGTKRKASWRIERKDLNDFLAQGRAD
jgi:excisionase family DNA binding protein